MDKLPILSGRKVVKALTRVGFYVHHQRGSHIVMKRENPPTRLTVPAHKNPRRPLLRAIIRQAGLTREEFLKLLE